ncbi:cell wall-associated hydrolase [Brevibacterium luteolum]|uniref:cell wall-associated hydrolase n=1 Tax=Brevibacterium luteolum TaxID=199591 RepID=UPI00223AFBE7|nr:cell wall-associated hydrolase [Brevibacterium luteolum]MCT1922266.1 cell wall-associated hydrolase [Brevibacterium luteolum]
MSTTFLSATALRIGTAAAALTLAATGIAVAPATAASGPDTAATQEQTVENDRRAEIINRAQFWVDQGVPYSMSAYYPDIDGKNYRTDCSGFVSMAWGLDDSLSTVTLVDVAHPIAKEDLQPGDVLMRGGPGTGGAAGHVAIFNGWANAERTAYHGLEQAGDAGAVTREIGYPYNGLEGFEAYRLNGL